MNQRIEEQQDALEPRLVELARMARRAETGEAVDHFGEADRPGHAGRRAPQFAVHEIGEPAEEQAERDAAGDIIVDAQPIELVLPRQVEDAEVTPITPPWNDMPPSHSCRISTGFCEIIERLVEQDVAEPAAEDDAERRVEDHVVGMAPGHRRAGLGEQLQQIPPAEDDAGEVGEAVPAQLEEAEVERDRIEAEIGRSGSRRVAVASDVSKASIKASPSGSRLHRGGRTKGKAERAGMPSELDRKYDAVLAEGDRRGGRIQIGRDAEGRAIVTNLPPTLPMLFDAFCALNGATEAVVAGDERLTFAELNAQADRGWPGRWPARGIAQGRPGRDRDAQLPGLDRLLHGGAQGGRHRDPDQRLVAGRRDAPRARRSTEPKLIIADAPARERLEAGGCTIPTVALPVEQPLDEALAPLARRGDEADLPAIAPEDDATILFTSGSTGLAKGAVSTHRAVTTGVYAYTIGLLTLLGIKESEGEPPANPPRTLVNVPLFHVTGEVPVLLNSFVIGRTMVLMPKWDAGEALRLIEQEKITYFVGVPTMSLELMQHPDRDKYDLSTLTDIAAGGAPRPVAHVKRLEESFTGAQPALGYGLTETNAVGCGNFWSNYHDKPASTGRPHQPIVELAILGEGDRHLPAGERGEIAIRSAANIRGYWRDEAATRAAFTADGYLQHRRHRLSRRGRLSVHRRPQEGHHHPRRREYQRARRSRRRSTPIRRCREAAVFGVADERLGEVPAAVVYCEQGGLDAEDAARLPRRAARPVQAARPHLVRTTSRCPSSAPARSTRSSSGTRIASSPPMPPEACNRRRDRSLFGGGPPKERDMRTMIIMAGAALVLAGCDGGAPESVNKAEPVGPEAVQNQLAAMPEGQRNAVFIRALQDAGEECQHVESLGAGRRASGLSGVVGALLRRRQLDHRDHQ